MMPSLRPRPLSAVPPTNSNQTLTRDSWPAYWMPASPGQSASMSGQRCSLISLINSLQPSTRMRWLIQHRPSGHYLGSIHLESLIWEELPELAFQWIDPLIAAAKCRSLGLTHHSRLQLVPLTFTRVATPDGVEWVVDG